VSERDCFALGSAPANNHDSVALTKSIGADAAEQKESESYKRGIARFDPAAEDSRKYE
jgi:hypothetical protein